MILSPGTIHCVLKERTKALHITLEKRLRVILSETLSLDAYAEIVKQLYGFYRPVEAQFLAISEWDDALLNLHERRKSSLLMNDLLALNIDPSAIASLPFCSDLPSLQTVPQALGCLYVLEGSTLGGKIITRHLKEVLSLDERRGCSFFNSYGNEVGSMWRGFLDALSHYCERHCNDEVIVESACQTFEAMDKWLTAPLSQLEYSHV